MNYRDKFYEKYVSVHTSHLYGGIVLDDIKRQFPVWQKYFGSFLSEDKEAKIIDLGCGDGGLVYWLQESGYHAVEGVDISGEQIEAAKKLGIRGVFKSDFLRFLKDKENFYDIIFARDILEHFTKEEVLGLLDIVNKSLKKGGVFIAQTVNAENWLWGRLRHGDFTHELAFTKESMRQILLVSGFDRVEIHPQRPVPHGAKSFVRYIFWMGLECLFRFCVLVETGSPVGVFTQNIIVKARK